MQNQPDITRVAAMIGDNTRATILIALMGGKALTATELATEAEVMPATASSHLAKLVENQLINVQKQGRHRYFQLSGPEIADLLETLLNVSARQQHSRIVTGPADPELRRSRICYDHLAGELGVALLDALISANHLRVQQQELSLTTSGEQRFSALGAELPLLKKKRRPLCKNCLDWSERRHHLAGALGQWVLDHILDSGWAVQDPDSRIIRFSTTGLRRFSETYGLG